MRGAVMVPWPNRTEDGRFTFLGERYQLPVDEPETHNAIHGLVAWKAFDAIRSTPNEAVLEGTLAASPGYPWQLRIIVSFHLDEGGLHQTVAVENQSHRPAPVGIGAHPYLVADTSAQRALDRWTFALNAHHVVLVSPDRLLPRAVAHIREQPSLDFRTERSLHGVEVNHCYTDLVRSDDGLAQATLRGPDGRGARISWDRRCEWVQVYSSDHPADGISRGALAVEPMTCPPNALNSGTDLLVVHPGSLVDAGWTISAV